MTWAIVTGMAIGAVVGGGAAALQKKDILQGALMGGVTGAVTGGIGSLGTSAATTGVAAAGESALASGATDAIGSSVLNSTASPISSGIEGLGAVGQNAGISTFNPSGMSGLSIPQNFGSSIAAGNPSLSVPTSMANAPALAPPSSNPFFADPMKYLGDNKMSIGLAGLAGGMAPSANQQKTGQQDTTIHPYSYSAGLNPGYTGAGTPYFNQSYNKLPTYNVANGGILSLAEGGETAPTNSTAPTAPVKKELVLADYIAAANKAGRPSMQAQYVEPTQRYAQPIQQVPQAVTDYNNTLMQRAQNEYVNSPQLGAFTSHFNDPAPRPANADATDAMYQKYLGRNADAIGYGANKNATPEQIAYGIQTSPEYMSANPNAPKPVMPVATGPASYVFNPATGGYTTSYAPVDPRAGIAALQQPQFNGYGYDQGSGDGSGVGASGAAGDGGSAGAGVGGNGGSAFAMGGGIGDNYDGSSRFNHGPEYPMQQPQNFNSGGGIYNLGGYSDGGRLLKGPGDGVSDDIPAQIGAKQPARLADGEFVLPARIVSELGNGSTDAGAKRLYAMMDRVQANRKKTVGKGKVAVNSKSSKYLPA